MSILDQIGEQLATCQALARQRAVEAAIASRELAAEQQLVDSLVRDAKEVVK